jgi:hypothetical protein
MASYLSILICLIPSPFDYNYNIKLAEIKIPILFVFIMNGHQQFNIHSLARIHTFTLTPEDC